MQDGKLVVLCVDDEQDVRDGLRMILEAEGLVVEEAANGADGLKAYQACSPDFVLVDMMMESVDAGLELAKKLKAAGTAPVYLLSSMSNALGDQVDPRSFGLDGTIQKPVDPATLMQTVRRATGS